MSQEMSTTGPGHSLNAGLVMCPRTMKLEGNTQPQKETSLLESVLVDTVKNSSDFSDTENGSLV